jgi:tripeptide aminopeptidase
MGNSMLFFDPPPVVPMQSQPAAHQWVLAKVSPPAEWRPAENVSEKPALPPVSSERLLQTFLELVQIPSPSGQEEKVRAYILSRLQELGLSEQATVDSAGNLILKIPSNVKAQKTVLLTVHMDVVPPCEDIQPTVEGEGDVRVIRATGGTVLGGDDKAAIAALLEALAVSLKHNLPRPNLIIPITVQEEIGGFGAAAIPPSEYRHADVAIALDYNEPPGGVVYAAPQLTKFEATVNGHSAHSGFEPEKGANAIRALTLAVSRFRQGRLDEDTTANVGIIKGGKKFNIVSDQAVAQGEVRSMSARRVDAELSAMKRKLDQATRKVPGTSYVWNQTTVVKPYRTDLNLPVFLPLKRATAEADLAWKPTTTNGGSDVNIFAQSGVPSVVLSGAYYNPHQSDEYVKLQDMKTLAQLLLRIFENYAQ